VLYTNAPTFPGGGGFLVTPTPISDSGYWQRRFNGDRSILVQTMTINATPHAVIGVMPEQFRFQRDPELILPLRFETSFTLVMLATAGGGE
jgi:hypothetical protein